MHANRILRGDPLQRYKSEILLKALRGGGGLLLCRRFDWTESFTNVKKIIFGIFYRGVEENTRLGARIEQTSRKLMSRQREKEEEGGEV